MASGSGSPRIDTADEELRNRPRKLLEEIVSEDAQLRRRDDREKLIEAALNEVVGLESLIADDGVTEIMVTAHFSPARRRRPRSN